MLKVGARRSARYHTRICTACGYRGKELQHDDGTVVTCPSCGCDLYSRPALSYAEMEGFADASEPMRSTPAPVPRQAVWPAQPAKSSSWGAVGLILILLLIVIAQAIVIAAQSTGS
ncbi:MAG: hypothetical protein KAS72_10735 [Phycisphaerales bacterium]|nr:hypothetical protein [Phycisphaerales bacterium]